MVEEFGMSRDGNLHLAETPLRMRDREHLTFKL